MEEKRYISPSFGIRIYCTAVLCFCLFFICLPLMLSIKRKSFQLRARNRDKNSHMLPSHYTNGTFLDIYPRANVDDNNQPYAATEIILVYKHSSSSQSLSCMVSFTSEWTNDGWLMGFGEDFYFAGEQKLILQRAVQIIPGHRQSKNAKAGLRQIQRFLNAAGC